MDLGEEIIKKNTDDQSMKSSQNIPDENLVLFDIDKFIDDEGIKISMSENIMKYVDEIVDEPVNHHMSYDWITTDQYTMLEKAFQQNQDWTKGDREFLSKKLNMDQSKIYKWHWGQLRKRQAISAG